jgi:hypothetical protein
VQIWTALIAILLLKILKPRSTFPWSMSNLVAMLRFNLFTYRDLWEWLNEPFQHPRGEMENLQLSFFPSVLGQHTGGVTTKPVQMDTKSQDLLINTASLRQH